MMKTIKYYTKDNHYMGWNKLCSKNLHGEVHGWLRSGHYVIIGGNRYDNGDFDKIIYREV